MVFTNTVETRTLDLLRRLMSLEVLEPYYLVGGTALALQIGHRLSIDLDFFGKIKLNPLDLQQEFEKLGETQYLKAFDTVSQYEINNIKVDIVNYNYALIKPINKIDGLRLASIEDIAAMKVFAIEARGSKKDFFDMYFLLKHFTIDEIVKFAQQKYPKANLIHIAKSFCFFDDAEEEFDPVMFEPASWDQVKQSVCREAQKILQ